MGNAIYRNRIGWGQIDTLPEWHFYFNGIVYNNEFYMMSGYDSINATTTCSKYNPSSKSFSYLANCLVGVYEHASAIVGDNIYIFGGANSSGTLISTSQKYNISTNTWSYIASMPVARATHRAISIGQYVYIFGGYAPFDGRSWRYDTINNVYLEIATMPSNYRPGYFGISEYNNNIYIFGGYDNNTAKRYKQYAIYSPSNNSWTEYPETSYFSGYSTTTSDGTYAYIINENADGISYNTTKYDFLNDMFESIVTNDNIYTSSRAGFSAYNGKIYFYGFGKVSTLSSINNIRVRNLRHKTSVSSEVRARGVYRKEIITQPTGYQEWASFPTSTVLSEDYPYQMVIYSPYDHKDYLCVSSDEMYSTGANVESTAGKTIKLYGISGITWVYVFEWIGNNSFANTVLECNHDVWYDATHAVLIKSKTTTAEQDNPVVVSDVLCRINL